MSKLALIFLVVAAACGGKAAPAPTAKPAEPAPVADDKPVSDVVAASQLAEQYQVGKELYVSKECASCHGDHGEGNPKNPALVGDGALGEKPAFAGAKLRKTVTFTTARDVFDFMKAHMPLKKPGTLTDDEYLAILAWDLNENKVALDHKLTLGNAGSIKLR